MQPSAGHELPAFTHPLPHTRSRPVHWLATGAAVAAAVAAAALAQPPDASASSAYDPGAPVSGAPDPSAAHYPLDCAGYPVDIVARASADLDGDGRPDTVAVVRCKTPMGTPPSGVYVLSPGARPRSAPRITAVLVDPDRKLSATNLEIHDRRVSATLWGYSSDDVPRCCPDLRRSFSWGWRDGSFQITAGPHAGAVTSV